MHARPFASALLMSAAAALMAPESVIAGFTGIARGEDMTTYQGSVYCIVDLYVTFDSTNDVLTGILDATVTVDGGFSVFTQNDGTGGGGNGGSWAPQFTGLGFPPNTPDSYLTIGGQPNFGNSTNSTPAWGPLGFNQDSIPAGAGWFNANPPNLQGKATNVSLVDINGNTTYAGAATRIGHFAFLKDLGPLSFTIDATANWNLGPGTPLESAAFSYSAPLCAVPAPGAVVLFALGGLAARRRRRPGIDARGVGMRHGRGDDGVDSLLPQAWLVEHPGERVPYGR